MKNEAQTKSVICAFRPMDPNAPGFSIRYLPGWNIEQANEHHPDFGKVLVWVRTKREAQKIVNTQQLPELKV